MQVLRCCIILVSRAIISNLAFWIPICSSLFWHGILPSWVLFTWRNVSMLGVISIWEFYSLSRYVQSYRLLTARYFLINYALRSRWSCSLLGQSYMACKCCSSMDLRLIWILLLQLISHDRNLGSKSSPTLQGCLRNESGIASAIWITFRRMFLNDLYRRNSAC